MMVISSFLLAALAAPAFAGPAPASNPPTLDPKPAVRLWLNSGRDFHEGERAKVEVEAAYDGYLVVLNYDTDGRLRVLFPIDPRDDNFVQGGRRYEIQGRGDRETFVVGRSGSGLVFAAVAADPFDFRDYDVGGNWDYDRLYVGDRSEDPEAEISRLLQRMTSERGFDYDLLDYRVYDDGRYDRVASWYPRPYGYLDDYYCDFWHRASLFGCRSYWPYYAGVWYSPSYYGFGFGYGYYGRGYYGYSYPYRYWNPWGGTRYYGRNLPVVVGRPRGYTIVRRGNRGDRAYGRPGGFSSGTIIRGQSPDVGNRSRPRYDGRTRARPDRPSNQGRPEARPNVRPDRDPVNRAPATDRPRARPVNPRPSNENRPYINRAPDRGRADVDRSSSSDRARPSNSDRARPSSNDRARPSNSDGGRRASPPPPPSRPSASPPPRSSAPESRARPSNPRSRPSSFRSAPSGSSRPSVDRASPRPSRPSINRSAPQSTSRPSVRRSAPRSTSRPSVSRSAPRSTSRPSPSRGSSRSRPRKP